MMGLKFNALCFVVVSLVGVFVAYSHADQPSLYRAPDGTLQCSILATGTSSKPFVDLDSPHVVSGFHLAVRPFSQRVYLVATVGYGEDALAVWRESLTDMAGSTIAYQMGDSEPADLTLPLTWSSLQTVHEVHDGEESERHVVLFDITRSPLGKHLLEINDNPAPLAIKHQAVLDHGYRINKLLRYRMGSDTTTITFKHFAESKAFCDRANSTGGFARWFGD